MKQPLTAPAKEGAAVRHMTTIRVRYAETDQMGTFYNSRALEWFEVGRTELMRAHGMPYVDWEAQGFLLPLVEAHVNYRGRARYDDALDVAVAMTMAGRASLKFAVTITRGGQVVAEGWTVHAIVDPAGKPTRPPRWLLENLAK
jgi:acyl-CoA thioester hydrolase